MPKVTKEGNPNWITATVDGTTWILNLVCLVARLDSKCYEKQVFQLQSSDDSFNEDNDIKVDFQTDDGEIVYYYTPTQDHTQLIDHPNVKWFYPGYFLIVLAWNENYYYNFL